MRIPDAVIIFGAGTSLLLLVQQWRAVEWRIAVPLAASGAVGVIPGVAVHALLPAAPLQVAIGGTTLALLLAVVVLDASRRPVHEAKATPPLTAVASTGVAAGAVNVVAGVGGVPLSVFAVLARWPAAAFAASAQFVFTILCGATIVGLGVVGSFDPPRFTAGGWIGATAVIIAGTAIGPWLARRTSQKSARRVMLVAAGAGAVASVVAGAADL
ncbi:TSUP family transporter [Labedella populi]|uniref:TSUP family transporter n=1 Tax=Labedella populi TaxID=2498850 RepID=UPI001408ADEB|nr:TSUP family transporter [Labedella populi]